MCLERQEERGIAPLLIRLEDIRRNHPKASGKGQPGGTKRLSWAKIAEWLESNAGDAYRYHKDSLKSWGSAKDGESPGIAAAMTAFVQAHDHLTSAAVRAKACSALKRVLAGEEAAQGGGGVAEQEGHTPPVHTPPVHTPPPHTPPKSKRGKSAGFTQSPQKQVVVVKGATEEHTVPAQWRLVSDREHRLGHDAREELRELKGGKDRASTSASAELRSVLEKAATAGPSPFPPESVSMAQRMMGAMPGVGHDAAAAAMVLASACFIHKVGLGGALDSETAVRGLANLLPGASSLGNFMGLGVEQRLVWLEKELARAARVFIVCDKGNRKGVDHFPTYAYRWCHVAQRVLVDLLSAEATGSTTDEAAISLRGIGQAAGSLHEPHGRVWRQGVVHLRGNCQPW